MAPKGKGGDKGKNKDAGAKDATKQKGGQSINVRPTASVPPISMRAAD
jgi:hypothetical protein